MKDFNNKRGFVSGTNIPYENSLQAQLITLRNKKRKTKMNYEQFLFDLSKKTAKILINLPSEANGKDVNPLRLYSKLIFPKYENDHNKIRVSEQEARFAFCQVFEQERHGLYYSIETPTENKYSFSNNSGELIVGSGQSAQSDMSIFSLTNSGFNQIINVEFKAKNVEIAHIKKDFLKLLAEQQDGLFFHLIESVNSGTLTTGYSNDKTKDQKGILTKYFISMDELKSNKKNEIINESWFLFFSICILSPEKYLITKVFKKSDFKNIKDFFDLQYSVSKGIIDFKDELKKSNPWNILQI